MKLLLLLAILLTAPFAHAQERVTYQFVNAAKLVDGTQYISPDTDRLITWIYEGTINFYQPQTQEAVDLVISQIPNDKPTHIAFWGNVNLTSFDDPKWDTFLTNMGYLANSARKHGFIGILWDSERYTDINLWSDTSIAKAKDRGKQYRQAIGDLQTGDYDSWKEVKGSRSYHAFWKAVGDTTMYHEDSYTYGLKIGKINEQIKNRDRRPCAGVRYELQGKQQACRWLYLEK